MRGDSLRDLYAKSLALLGLGVLAGVGALFDYWPITNDVPAVSRLKYQPADVPSIPMPAYANVAMPTIPRRAAARPAVPARTLAAPLVAPAELPTFTLGAAVVSSAPFRVGRKAAFTAFEFRAAVEPAVVEPALIVATAVPPPDEVTQEVIPMAAPARGDDGSAVGFVTGALKKTGQTIARTGARTGASIRDALVSFGGAFRKIL